MQQLQHSHQWNILISYFLFITSEKDTRTWQNLKNFLNRLHAIDMFICLIGGYQRVGQELEQLGLDLPIWVEVLRHREKDIMIWEQWRSIVRLLSNMKVLSRFLSPNAERIAFLTVNVLVEVRSAGAKEKRETAADVNDIHPVVMILHTRIILVEAEVGVTLLIAAVKPDVRVITVAPGEAETVAAVMTQAKIFVIVKNVDAKIAAEKIVNSEKKNIITITTKEENIPMAIRTDTEADVTDTNEAKAIADMEDNVMNTNPITVVKTNPITVVKTNPITVANTNPTTMANTVNKLINIQVLSHVAVILVKHLAKMKLHYVLMMEKCWMTYHHQSIVTSL